MLTIPRQAAAQPAASDCGGDRSVALAKAIVEACTECGACSTSCAFLAAGGGPKSLLLGHDFQQAADRELAYQCSLCGLCSAICPEQLDPCGFFEQIRHRHGREGSLDPAPYRQVLRYEQLGTSALFSGYALPPGCRTVFFPGCALPGSRPGVTLQLFRHLQKVIPALGLVLDCCSKPSHDLGLLHRFQSHWEALLATLVEHGVTMVVVACPNCHKMFRRYAPMMTVKTVYEMVDPAVDGIKPLAGRELSVHDPCPLRHQSEVHRAVRGLLLGRGARLREMKHAGRTTFCCGEGGMVAAKKPAFSRHWAQQRVAEAEGRTMVSYCVGCCYQLGRLGPTVHIVDLLFGPAGTGKIKVSRAPMTDLNRLIVKYRLKKILPVMARLDRTKRLAEK